MPLVPNLEFASQDLYVSYRASAEPQELSISIVTDGPAPYAEAPGRIGMLLDIINSGGAGGTEFDPSWGRAEVLSGQKGLPEALGPRFQYVLRVAAVSPRFIRNIVEALRRVGVDHRVTQMAITGALAADDSALSVRTATVREWLDSRDAYPGEWAKPGFPVESGIAVGASVYVQLADPLTREVERELRRLIVLWIATVGDYVGGDGAWAPRILHKTLPHDGAGKTEFRAVAEDFEHVLTPSRAVLVNLLSRFHHDVSPVLSLEVRL